jgi:hypothetical protein
MLTQHRMFGWAMVALAMVAGLTIASSRASADDARMTVAPAIYRVDDAHRGTPVQTVQWYGGGYYRPYYRPYYRSYYRPYYRSYYYGGYAQPYYSGYGYGYPAYGYTYGYPAYGYYGYGPGAGVSVGRVGVGVW